jgi:hypothetical protein
MDIKIIANLNVQIEIIEAGGNSAAIENLNESIQLKYEGEALKPLIKSMSPWGKL